MGKKETAPEPAPAPASSNLQKWKYTLITTVIFLLIANPYTYQLVQAVLGKFIKIAKHAGCATIAGLLVHAVVFTLILRLIMDIKV